MSERLVAAASRLLARKTTRRGFLVKTAVVGSAAVAAPVTYALRPRTAYASVCGSGADCASGWTAFCCTINDGVNRCPPGSFVAGWWKVDDSNFCCGPDGSPRPRYYIDCQGSCTKCTSGCGSSPFCDPSCVNCSGGCANTGTCDQRRVCRNYFRYGQCHREVGCTGPVACRVVTCTPPYVLYPSCSSASATDNRTASHSAPCLAGPCR